MRAPDPTEHNPELIRVQEALESIIQSATSDEKKLKTVRTKRAKLEKEQIDLEISFGIKEHLEKVLREAVLLKEGLPPGLKYARSLILTNLENAQRKDLPLQSIEALKTTAEQQKKELQKVCMHKFVVGYSSYSGDRGYDYENAYTGMRLCVVCGLQESSLQTNEQGPEKYDLFETLKEGPGRIVKGNSLKQNSSSLNIWVELEGPDGLLEQIFRNSLADQLLKKLEQGASIEDIVEVRIASYLTA